MWEGLGQFAFGWIIAFFIQGALWIHQEKNKNATFVDIAWALTIALLAIIYSMQSDSAHPTQRILTIALPCFWAFRLSIHLYNNRIRGGLPEDSRYAALRRNWGADASFKFFLLFQAQALVSALMATTFIALLSRESAHPLMIILGLMVWLTAIIGETLADQQLQEFKLKTSDRTKTCRLGLWKYSRHPNYFFEWLGWCSYILMTASVGRFFAAMIAPIVIFLLLHKMTGIPPAEAQALQKRGDDYRDYQKTTPAFFPWKPKIK